MTLTEFLNELGKSHGLRARFIRDPIEVCDEFKVSEEDRKALRTNDQAAIDAVLDQTGNSALWIVNAAWIVNS
jgi:hypothetical protein